MIDRADAAILIENPAFRRLLFAGIRAGGGFDPAASQADGRHLFLAGRRSLALELLHAFETMQPAQVPGGVPVFSLIQTLAEAAQTAIKEKASDRRIAAYAARGDPEIGGAKWGDTIATAASALDRLGFTKGSAFRNLLDESGLGNHPDMIRAFVKVGKAISEDNDFVLGGGIPRIRRDRAETLYPHDHPKEGQ